MTDRLDLGDGYSDGLRWTLREGVCHLELDRPHSLNALDAELVEVLLSRLELCSANDECRAVVLTGRGRAFCAGFDLRQAPDRERDGLQLARMQQLTKTIRAMPAVVVAGVHGHVVGGGFELALACDLILAAGNATFSLPDVPAGLAPGGGATKLLAQAVGAMRARQLLLLGEPLNARQALSAGMVARVVDLDELAGETVKLAIHIASLPSAAMASTKSAIERAPHCDLESVLAHELDEMVRTLHATEGSEYRDTFRSAKP